MRQKSTRFLTLPTSELPSSETAASKTVVNLSSVSQASNRLTQEMRTMMPKEESLRWSRKAEKMKLMRKMPLKITKKKTTKIFNQATKLLTPIRKMTKRIRTMQMTRVTTRMMEVMVRKRHR